MFGDLLRDRLAQMDDLAVVDLCDREAGVGTANIYRNDFHAVLSVATVYCR